MPEIMRESVGLPWIGGWGGDDRRGALKHKVMLGVISAMLSALLQGCTADKAPSQGETGLANAAKDVTIPLQAGKMQNPLPVTAEVVSQGQEVFLGSCAQCHGADARGDTPVNKEKIQGSLRVCPEVITQQRLIFPRFRVIYALPKLA